MKEKEYQQEVLKIAIEIAKRAHANQFRKGGNVPYIEHPQDVVRRIGNLYSCYDIFDLRVIVVL